MRKKQKYIFGMLCLVLGIVMLGGCGGPSDIQKDVTMGRSVFADGDGTLYFGYDRMVCTAKMEGSKVSGFSPVTEEASPVLALAVHEDQLYVMSGEGLTTYPLSELGKGAGNVSGKTITRDHLEAPGSFEIYGDDIFFTRGDVLCCVPAGGGNITELREGVADFEVTDKGIYYVNGKGTLSVISSDLSEDEEIGKLPKGAAFMISGADLYYSNKGIIESFSVKTKRAEDTGNGRDANDSCVPWVNGDHIFYADDRSKCHLITSSGETDAGRAVPFPEKADGYMTGNCLVAVSADSKRMQVIDLEEATVIRYELEDFMAQHATGAGKTEN